MYRYYCYTTLASGICSAQTQGGVIVALGDDYYGQVDVPVNLTNVVAISAQWYQSLALKSDGSVVGWGSMSAIVPDGVSNCVAIAVGYGHSLALLTNGTVIGWGDDSYGQIDVPSGLTNVVAIAAGKNHSLALKQDGTVVAWGDYALQQTFVPANLSNVKAIAGGEAFSLALKTDGTIVGWGWNGEGEISIPQTATNVVSISAGDKYALALKADGKVIAWGNDENGVTDVPTDLSNVVAIAAGGSLSVALKSNGIPVGWGSSYSGQIAFPTWLTNVVSIAAGEFHSLALMEGGPVVIQQPTNSTVFSGDNAGFKLLAIGPLPISYQWQHNGTNINSPNTTSLTISSVQPTDAGIYDVILTNSYGISTSSIAALTVVTSSPVVISQPVNQTVVYGSNAVFSVSTTGSLPIYYQWTFNGTNIVGANSATVLLQNVKPTDAGAYAVTASNTFGIVASSNALLFPVPPPIIIGWGFTNNDNGNYAGQIYPPPGLTKVMTIAAGGSHSLALKYDGSVVGWGDDNNGVSSYTTNLSSIVAIAAGWQHSVALKSDGTVVAWGGSSAGETNVPAGLSNVVAIAAGGCDCGPDPSSTLALKNDGTVVGWGGTLVPTNLANVIAIAAGSSQDLALEGDGTLISWGNVSLAGPPSGKATVVTNGITNIVAIACGESHALALRFDGTVFAWGNNYYGQTNVPSGLSNVVSIAAGENFNLALQNNGKVVAWGKNNYGETATPSNLSNVVAIAGGWEHSLALVNDGTPVIVRQPLGKTVFSGSTVTMSAGAVAPAPLNLQWQLNSVNIVEATNNFLVLKNVQTNSAGNYTLVASNPNTGVAVSSNAVLTVLNSPPIILNQPTNAFVLSGGNTTLSVSTTGSLPANFQWQFNGTNISNATNATLTLINLTWPNNGAYTVIISNAYGTVVSSNAILTLPRSLVVAWGNNSYGQTNVPLTLTNAIGIAAGYENSMAVKADGTVAGWGYNGLQETPPPTGLSNVTAIATSRAASGAFSLALKTDGTVFGWGNNAYKQTNAPSGLSNVVAIAAGQYHGLALRNDGRVFAWGNNTYGQTNVPATLTNAIAIAAGYNSCLALQNGGSLVAWGDNTYGQTNIPSGLTNVTTIASGWYHCLALKNDGTITAWGNNNYQQTNVPAGLSNVIAIAVGQYHSLAVKNDGTVVAWGQNTYKQTNVPAGLNHVVDVAGGADHSLALIQDGPPLIFTQPISQTNYAGFTVFLGENSSGLQPLYFQWILNGTNLIGATNSTLMFTNLQPANAGIYSFNVSNALGVAVSSNAFIGVLTNSPILTLQPTNQMVIAGSNVTFSVTVGSGPIPNVYQWQFNGTNILGASNTVLTLTNVKITNQGNYVAVVNNGYGTVTSSNAYLTVIVLDLPTALNTPGWTWTSSGSAVWFAETSSSYDGFEAAQSGAVANGQSSTLQTTVAGPGTLTFWWKFSPLTSPFANALSFSSSQGNAFASVNSTTGWQQKTICLGVGQQTLTWNYSRYSFISAASTGWVDQVSFSPGSTSPSITSMSPNTYMRANSNVVFSVGAYGTPPLTYQWQLNGTNLLNKTNTFLSFTGVQPTNTGIYTVIITNGFGSIATNAALWVGRFALNTGPTNLFMSTNGFQLNLDGVLTTNPVVLFGSTDLVNWLPLFTNSATTGSVQFLDVTATNMPTRFYRAQE